MKAIADIDIDVADRNTALGHFSVVPASILRDDELVPHPVGVYFQDIPVDPLTGLASIPNKEAQELGYTKIEFLNVTLYNSIRDTEHLDALMAKEPLWDMLEHEVIVSELFHIGGHFDIVKQHKPKSIEQLAMVLAMIRPAKRYLIGKSWAQIEKEIWLAPSDGTYYYKKSHSISYALVVAVQMNLIVEGIMAAG